MLYVERHVISFVGGLHLAYGRHGGEHQNWSDRIHAAGLTRWPYADVTGPRLKCRDEIETDISSIDWREHQTWRHVRSEKLSEYAEYRDQPIPVLVPRRPDNGQRDKLWQFVREAFWRPWHSMRIVEGPHLQGPFNRSAGVNLAAQLAGNWDVAVIADSDSYAPFEQILTACAKARLTGKLVAAFDRVIEVSEAATNEIMWHGDLLNVTDGNIRTKDHLTQSTMLAVPRTLWETVGGFDERFRGWGGEDNAFWHACKVIAGPPLRIDGPAYHLWHPPANHVDQRTDPLYKANHRLWQAYRHTTTERDLRKVQRR
jgi:hypothetical protein